MIRFGHFALLLALIVSTCLLAGEDKEKWKPPDAPKDDAHWYPEFPNNKELNESLINGGFEDAAGGAKGDPAHPKGWAHVDGLTSFWKDEPGHGKVIMLQTDITEDAARKHQTKFREAMEKNEDAPPSPAKDSVKTQGYDAIGGTYGVSLYSEKFKCKPKQAYKISFDFKGPGGAKVWVRGWGEFRGEDRRRWETIVNCRTAGEGWRHFEQAFHPTRRPLGKDKETFIEISYLRVMLYAYWPPAQYYFDNIKIEEISDEEYARLKAIPADAR